MDLAYRVKYTAFLVVVVGMVSGLVASIAGLDALALLGHPVFVLIAVVVSFIASPWLSERLPFKR